jgi:hypothetical protein
MNNYLKYDWGLASVEEGYCFWRNPENNRMSVTNAALEQVFDVADIDSDYETVSFIGGRFLISSKSRKGFLLSDAPGSLNFLKVNFKYALGRIKELYSSDGVVYFKTHTGVLSIDMKSYDARLLYVLKNMPVFVSGCNGGVISSSDVGVVERRNWNNEVLWQKSLYDYLLGVGKGINPESIGVRYTSGVIGDKVIIHLKDDSIVCLQSEDGSLCWYLENALKYDWSFNCEKKIVGIYNSKLRIINIDSGSICEHPIGADWVTSDIRLHNASATQTHLWSGFFGRGLCAINLENGNIDYHVFDGGTCDAKPKILNNRVFVAIRNGGLGLESNRQEYILEGHGDYKPDADGFFVIP